MNSLFFPVIMEKIQRDNCARICQEEFCSSRYTHFCNILLNGLRVHLAFCEKHAQEFEENGWKQAHRVESAVSVVSAEESPTKKYEVVADA